MGKKILAMLLAVVLAVSLLPGTAWAADSDFVIEDGVLVKYIGPGGDVVIPDGVTSIGDGAFYACENLSSVVIPDGVTTIGDDAFFGCLRMTSVTIPNTVTYIGMESFACCISLTSVTIPNGVAGISGVFFECQNLTSVTIPSSVTRIGPQTFQGCESLTDVYYGGSAAQWEAILVFDNYKGVTITFANGGQEFACLYNATIHYNSTGPELEKPTKPETPSFKDVDATAYYAPAVAWAVENSITAGTSSTAFSPDAPCTRAQIVTFLWRAYGSPKAASAENPFTDVKPGDYYYDAVLWAVESGITSGKTASTFDPDGSCTRKEAVTFQYRAAGSPTVSGGSSFKDVPSGDWFAAPVAWAVANGITSGTSSTAFSPDAPCTRAQIVTFLYRELGA